MARTKKKKVTFNSNKEEGEVHNTQDTNGDPHADDLGDLENPAKLTKPIKTVQVTRLYPHPPPPHSHRHTTTTTTPTQPPSHSPLLLTVAHWRLFWCWYALIPCINKSLIYEAPQSTELYLLSMRLSSDSDHVNHRVIPDPWTTIRS